MEEKIERPSSEYYGNYRGEVVDNNDPLQAGRVRVKVFDFMGELTPADYPSIPWAVPAYPIADGAGVGFGYFSVPRLNSNVFVFFEGGDVFQPVYFAEAPDVTRGLPGFRTVNYPDTKGWRLKNGVEFFVNEALDYVAFNHPAGTTVEIFNDGKVDVNIAADTNLVINGNTTALFKGTTAATFELPVTALFRDTVGATFEEAVTALFKGTTAATFEKSVTATFEQNLTALVLGLADITATLAASLNALAAVNVSAIGDVALTSVGKVSISGSSVEIN